MPDRVPGPPDPAALVAADAWIVPLETTPMRFPQSAPLLHFFYHELPADPPVGAFFLDTDQPALLVWDGQAWQEVHALAAALTTALAERDAARGLLARFAAGDGAVCISGGTYQCMHCGQFIKIGLGDIPHTSWCLITQTQAHLAPAADGAGE